MADFEYKPWKFFVNMIIPLWPEEKVDYAFFKQFKPRFIWNRDKQILERCIKIGDVGAYIADRLRKENSTQE